MATGSADALKTSPRTSSETIAIVPKVAQSVHDDDGSSSIHQLHEPAIAAEVTASAKETLDIEHMPVADDPRQWSAFRKNLTLLLVSGGAMIAGLSANIQNPGIEDMERELRASPDEISLSISLFILVQGCAPILWSSVSEVMGRKIVYIVSLAIYAVGSVVVALSPTIQTVIGFRILQAAGSSAVMAIGAATLADIFEPHERGQKMGIYYMAPLLGPCLGPILGGALTTAFSWRAAFWFLVIVSGLTFSSFLLFFKDTFRKERSLTYQNVLRHRLKEQARKLHEEVAKERKKALKRMTSLDAHGLKRHQPHHHQWKPVHSALKTSQMQDPKEQKDVDLEKAAHVCMDHHTDVEHHKEKPPVRMAVPASDMPEIKLTLRDVSPIKPSLYVLRRLNNCVILTASGVYFALNFVIVYTSSRTLGMNYGLNALKIGLVLLSFGIGSIAGSIIGGRWSDCVLAMLREKSGRKTEPEMRLRSTIYGLFVFPLFVIAYGWLSHGHVHIAALCVFLFICGFLAIWIYTSTLAYIVDSNVGRSSAAVALNSCARGMAAFIGTEVTVPIQDSLGDGWFYTFFGIVLLVSGLMTLAVMRWGGGWRRKGEEREAEAERRRKMESGLGSSAATAVATPVIGHGSVRPGSPV